MALRTLPQIVQAAEWPNVRAFTCILAYGEVGKTEGGWNIRYGGVHQPPKTFDSFADHPRIYELTEDGQKSSAAGRFQITASTWDDFIRACGPMDFSPANQYLSAVWLMERAKALDDVIAGRIEQAMAKLGGVWVSLRTDRVKKAAAQVYRDNGGLPPESFEPQKTQPEVKPMPIPAILGAVLPALFQAAPDLIRLFGKGEQSQKNAAVAEKVAEVAKDVTGAINEQEAAEKIANDPQAAQAFREAVAMNFDQWLGMTMKFADMDEASRAKAREFATGYAREPVLGRLTFIELLSLLMMTIAATGGGYVLWGNFPAEIKGAVVTMMFLGGWNGVKEFWFGSSYGSRTKDAPPK